MLPAVSLLSKALRNIIAKSPPSSPEAEAKAGIVDKINEFINIRITLAAAEIGKNAITKIREEDVILTYGRCVVCPLTTEFLSTKVNLSGTVTKPVTGTWPILGDKTPLRDQF